MKNISFFRLKWLPNVITSMRILLGVLAFFAAIRLQWSSALWLLLGALATDFLDGYVARKFDLSSKFGEEFDAISDSVIVFLGMFSLGVTGIISWWMIASVFAAGLAISSDRFFKQPVWRWRAILAVATLFMAWVGIAWAYASLAYGWSWLYPPITLVILTVCGFLKRSRIATWLKPISDK